MPTKHGPSIRTERLLLRRWRPEDLYPFARLNADPEVMEYFPARLSAAESAELARRADRHFQLSGYGLFAVQLLDGPPFIGFVGLSRVPDDYPCAPAVEVGWRLARAHWGRGYASEAALASLKYAAGLGLKQVVSFTSETNWRSRRVMERIGMVHHPIDDFLHPRLPVGHPLRPHVLYRVGLPDLGSSSRLSARASSRRRDDVRTG